MSYFEQTQTEEMSKSVLLRIHFHRIILDQAEEIKNSTSAQSVSVCRIRSTMKWVIFPDGIRDEEMYGFVRFLKISPLDDNSVSFISIFRFILNLNIILKDIFFCMLALEASDVRVSGKLKKEWLGSCQLSPIGTGSLLSSQDTR